MGKLSKRTLRKGFIINARILRLAKAAEDTPHLPLVVALLLLLLRPLLLLQQSLRLSPGLGNTTSTATRMTLKR